MKQRISTLIGFLTRDKASASPETHDEDGLRDGASLRPERSRERRGKRAQMRRSVSWRPARTARCAG
ncbi:hypothetical protein [Paraburkholderia sp. C35]|uniref:hypothetical protein n=1 Tax=Paraburkholderia sp. C35 TaxID=2126993 RepID=UPI000D69ABEE|nr:hypothetical protein [Paraburkholderia sp. C35]